ncbi:MAG TPA: YjgN family protein [Polyangiaceae bacterium]|jgi:uncharacterized membrane protein YjgN (DUF898 family)
MNQYPPLVVLGERSVEAEPPAPEPRELAFEFTGTASEYFRIWIVNLLLTIVTLGVYSAWAKVRNKQYFYRHTFVDGTSFEYVADPVRILKGRLLVAAVLGAIVAAQVYSLALYAALLVALVLVTPWAAVKALAFNAYNSSYRNVRFSFRGKPGEAFALYLAMTFFYVITCGIGYPFAQWRLTQFVAVHHHWGDTRFAFGRRSGEYYHAYVVVLLLSLPLYALLFGVLVALIRGGETAEPTAVVFLVTYAGLLIPAAFLRARLANLFYGGIGIGPHQLSSFQTGKELLVLYATNLAAIVASLGLLIPWAKIRLARYRARCTRLYAAGPLYAEAPIRHGETAVGDAATDLGDLGIDLGL